MKFSGKITNSFITFLHQKIGAEVFDVLEMVDLPPEFLRDPTCWLEGQKVEEALRVLENFAVLNGLEDKPLEIVGHSARSLKAWGVLDSVLSMIEKPNDIFLQPQRFISYFIFPAPPVGNIKRGPHSVSFDLPISIEEFPSVLTYLKSAIEAVPLFAGLQMAECQWQQNTISISWSPAQPTLGDPVMTERKIAPDLMHNLMVTLERTEQALNARTTELEKIKRENALAAQSQLRSHLSVEQLQSNSNDLKQKVLRLKDYFARSQQLITLLIGQDRNSTQIREAMRRVNWDQIQELFPVVTAEVMNQLDEPLVNFTEIRNEQNIQSSREGDSGQPWLPHS